MNRFVVVVAGLAATAVVVPQAVRRADAFCGFYVGGGGAELFNNATTVVLMREGTRTVLSMQNSYQGPAADFAMVVPVPSVLQEADVKTLPREIFARVDQLAAPRLVEYWEQDPCDDREREEGRMVKRSAAPRDMAAKKDASDDDLGVTVEAQFTVGEYEIVILSAKDSQGLDTWLRQEKYNIPAGAEAVLKPYVAAGMKFFVAKVDVEKVTMKDGVAVLSPLRFHYDTEKFELPVRLGLLNSAGTQDLIVHILAKGKRYQVQNYKNVFIPTNLGVAEEARDKFGPFYAALFDATLAKHPGAVVTEYSWAASSCDPCPTPALSYSELMTLGADVLPQAGGADEGRMGRRGGGGGSGFVLTRLHTRYTKEALGEDLIFSEAEAVIGGREMWSSGDVAQRKLEEGAQPSGTNNFQGRYIIRHPWTGKIECTAPRRGVWGGPPGSHDARPESRAATDLAQAPRGGIKLARLVTQDVPELGIRSEAVVLAATGAAAADTAATGSAHKTNTQLEQHGKGSGWCACELGGRAARRGRGVLGGGAALGLLGLGLLIQRRVRAR